MSIHIVLGKPGSGKSMYGMHLLVKQLLETTRNVVTNLPVKLGELNEYLQKINSHGLCDLLGRLRIMSDDEMRTFWKLRGPAIPDKPGGDDMGRGVCYILDEAHIAFNARDWATLGRDAIFYMSQHRKLGDMVIPITQSVGNLDKQFRSVAEDYTTLRNEYTAKMGPFRGAGRFVRKSYYGEPQRNSEPFEVATFRIDTKGIASCYDTARGIGIHGTKADIGRRAKGIPIWWVFPILIGVAMLIVFVPWLIGRMASGFIAGPKSSTGEAVAAAQHMIPKSLSGPEVSATPAGTQGVPAPVAGAPQAGWKTEDYLKAKPDGPTITGFVIARGSVRVVRSDGSTISEDDARVRIKQGRVRLNDGPWITPEAAPLPPPPEGKNFTTILQGDDKKELDKPKQGVIVDDSKSYDGVTSTQTTNTGNPNEQAQQQNTNRGNGLPRPSTTPVSVSITRDVQPANPGSVRITGQVPKQGTGPVRH